MSSDIRDSGEQIAAPSSHAPDAAGSQPCVMSVEDRAARMDRVWNRHEAGKLVTLDEYLTRRGL